MLGYRAEDVVGRLTPLTWHDHLQGLVDKHHAPNSSVEDRTPEGSRSSTGLQQWAESATPPSVEGLDPCTNRAATAVAQD
jgi:hypothetical protein